MVDRPDRDEPRLPPDAVPAAADAIAAQLDDLGAGAADVGFCGGACGGDLLFAAALLARGGRLEIHLALPEPEFLETSVAFAGDEWVSRYRAVTSHPRTTVVPPSPEAAAADDPFSRANLAMLEAACATAPGALVFIALWDGTGGDGEGGTHDMMRRAREAGAEIRVIDTRALR
jgi:hypothetical protein